MNYQWGNKGEEWRIFEKNNYNMMARPTVCIACINVVTGKV